MAAAERWTPEPPSLELSAKTDRYTRNEGVREYDAGVAIPLWLPGERSRAHASASSEAFAVDARLQASQWRLAAEVREAYWAYQRASSEQQAAQQRLANARQLAQDVTRRVRAGDLARSDSHQAEGTVAAAEAALAEAHISRIQAATAWRALTGLQEPAVEPSSASETRPSQTFAEDLHPVLRDLVSKADVARTQRELAGVQTRANPELTVGAVRERDGLGERYGLSPGSGDQLVHRVSDLLPMVCKRADHNTKLIGSHGYHLQGIEDDFHTADAEDWIYSRAGDR